MGLTIAAFRRSGPLAAAALSLVCLAVLAACTASGGRSELIDRGDVAVLIFYGPDGKPASVSVQTGPQAAVPLRELSLSSPEHPVVPGEQWPKRGWSSVSFNLTGTELNSFGIECGGFSFAANLDLDQEGSDPAGAGAAGWELPQGPYLLSAGLYANGQAWWIQGDRQGLRFLENKPAPVPLALP